MKQRAFINNGPHTVRALDKGTGGWVTFRPGQMHFGDFEEYAILSLLERVGGHEKKAEAKKTAQPALFEGIPEESSPADTGEAEESTDVFDDDAPIEASGDSSTAVSTKSKKGELSKGYSKRRKK